MDQHRNALRLGAWVILFAAMVRLMSMGFFQPLLELLHNPNVQSFLIYIETGRKVRFSPSSGDFDRESPPPQLPAAEELPVFDAEDGCLDIYYSCALRPELEPLLEQELNWNLKGEEPAVLILHTHATESYTKTEERYQESSAFRTLDENYNMLSIGTRVADILSSHGISVIHDRELHDYPSYDGSYNNARRSTQYYLEKYPSIQLVLDLHRDASGDLQNQMRPLATVDGRAAAQLMLVVGTDVAGLSHPGWRENLALGLKLQTVLEQLAPGITRPINLRSQRFNQDLSPGALLVEVGAAGNTHTEARLAAEKLAEAILVLARGSK